MSFRRAAILCVALATALGLPSSLFAQGQTGTIAGSVKDTTGAVLPGVTVEAASPALIEKTRSVVTDGQGAYKIVDLRPGVYTVTFSLPGFATVKREGIELTTAFTANVSAELRVGGVAETITVSGESPIVDVQNVMQKSTATREVMDAIPTDRNFVSFAALTPAVLVTGVRQNVGGSIPETGMNLVAHGSRAGDSLVMVDGMPIINGSGAGGLQYGNYLNNAMAQEITFQTDAQSAEFERASVYSNFIPKEGSNLFHGFFTGRFTNDSLEADNLNASYIGQGLKSGSKVSKIWDANPAGGGPIVKDRMWIYLSYRHWGTYNTVAGSFKDADFTEFPYYSCKPNGSGACTTEQNLFPVWHWAADARLTTQLGSKNKVNLYYDPQYTYFGNCFVPTLATAISACPEYKNIPQYIIQASWSSPVTNKLLLEAGATLTAQDFHGYPRPGLPLTQFQVTDTLAPAGSPTTWGSGIYGANRSDQSNYRVSASYVTGTHAVKVGMTLMHQWRLGTTEPNNSVTLALRNTVACQAGGVECGAPFSLTQYATPIETQEHVNYNMGIFAQDQWTFKRLTANYGVRLDFLNASVDAQSLPAGPFVPARNFEGVPDVPNWKDVNPRLGVAYDLTGNGKTAVKASIGRYVIAQSYGISSPANPVNSSVNNTTRTWADPSGTFNPFNDCDLTNPAANSKFPGQVACGAIQNPGFGHVQTRTTNYDPNLVIGWGVRPNNWEAQLSVQRELIPRVSAYAGYSRRWFGNSQVTTNRAVNNASYTAYSIPIPVDARLPNSGGTLSGLYDINRATTADNLITTAKVAGVNIEDVYDGFDFNAAARLGRGMQVSGGVSVGRERTNNCDLVSNLSFSFSAALSRSDRAYCDVHPPFQPQWKANATYPLPWWGIQISGNFQSLSGPELSANYPLTNAIAFPSLGRNLTIPLSVALVPPSTLYGDRIYQTDIRFNKTIKTGRTTIRPTISLFNLFNANPIQTYTTTYGAAWLAPTVILNPRFMDFGVQIDF